MTTQKNISLVLPHIHIPSRQLPQGLAPPKTCSNYPYDRIDIYSPHSPHDNFIKHACEKTPTTKIQYIRQSKAKLLRCHYKKRYRSFAELGSITVKWNPLYGRLPYTIISINIHKLNLTPDEFIAQIASIIPIQGAKVAYYEAKLDLEVDTKAIIDLLHVKRIQKVLNHPGTNNMRYGGLKSARSVSVYDKAKHLGIDATMTRVEARIRVPKQDRQTLMEFLEHPPTTPFKNVLVADPRELDKLHRNTSKALLENGIHLGLSRYKKHHSARKVEKIKDKIFTDWLDLDELWRPLANAWSSSTIAELSA